MENTIKEILRAQFDGRKGHWRVVKKTYNGCGGWKKFGVKGHQTREDCEKLIDTLIADYPDWYEKEL